MLDKFVRFIRVDKESLNNLLFTMKLMSSVTLVSSSIYTSYVFYKNDFNFTKSLKHFKRFHYKILYGDYKFRKTPDSFFYLSLNDKLSYNIAIYFIQLDLDKENGVTYSDLVNIWNKFELDSKILDKKFSDKLPKNQTERLIAGIPLQTFGEAFEFLILEKRTVNRDEAGALEESICSKFEDINKSTSLENLPFRLSNPHVSSSLNDIKDKLLSVRKSKAIEESELTSRILEMETQMLALKKQISQQKSVKKPLTEAEEERLNLAQKQLDELNYEIKRLNRARGGWF